jgi:hypothetical protein
MYNNEISPIVMKNLNFKIGVGYLMLDAKRKSAVGSHQSPASKLQKSGFCR